MGEWSRRQVLAALGAGALGPLAHGCHAGRAARGPRRPLLDVEDELAAAVEGMARTLDEPRGVLVVLRRGRVALDGEGGALERTIAATAWLGGRRAGRSIE